MAILFGICDDAELWRNQMSGCVQDYIAERQIEGECLIYASAEEYVEAGKAVDILLLDIEMDGMSGIELKNLLAAKGSEERILFATSYQEYIRDAFGRNVYGFIDKPVDKEDVYSRFDRIVQEIEECVEIPLGRGRSVLSDKIMYIKAVNKYVEIHTTDAVEIGYYGLKEYEEMLPVLPFRRVHRSYVVNYEYVRQLGSVILMKDGKEIRARRGDVKQIKTGYFDFIRARARG